MFKYYTFFFFYKQSGPCFYHPLFSKDSQERLTYILAKNILPWVCGYFWLYDFLKWNFSGRTIHAHKVWYACHSLATNPTCLLFVTAQDTNSKKKKNLGHLSQWHCWYTSFWKTYHNLNALNKQSVFSCKPFLNNLKKIFHSSKCIYTILQTRACCNDIMNWFSDIHS